MHKHTKFSKKIFLLPIVGLIIAITVGVFAGSTGTGSISPTVGGASGGGIANVTFASSGNPSWNPITGEVGAVTSGDLYNIDTTGTNPHQGDVFLTLYINNGDELAATYNYLNQQINVKMLSSQVTGEAVGTGNGTQTVFTLANAPVAPTTLVVKVAAVTKTEGTDYTVNYKTGSITFTSAPANSAAITADYWFNNPASGTAYKPAPTAAGKKIETTLLTLTNGKVMFIIAGDTAGAKYRVNVDDGGWSCKTTSGTLGPSYFLDVTQA